MLAESQTFEQELMTHNCRRFLQQRQARSRQYRHFNRQREEDLAGGWLAREARQNETKMALRRSERLTVSPLPRHPHNLKNTLYEATRSPKPREAKASHRAIYKTYSHALYLAKRVVAYGLSAMYWHHVTRAHGLSSPWALAEANALGDPPGSLNIDTRIQGSVAQIIFIRRRLDGMGAGIHRTFRSLHACKEAC